MTKIEGLSINCGFALAISWLDVKDNKVSRGSWNGEKWLKQIASNQWGVTSHHVDEVYLFPNGFIAMVTEDTFEPWIPTHSDLLAHDWCLLDNNE
jgi:hypothetical protein